MKFASIAYMSILLTVAVSAKPMTTSVRSWEGEFKLKPGKISIHPQGKPKLTLWLYQLEEGSKGTCVGFSREDGNMILAPVANEKGIQPVYTGHLVLFGNKGIAEIIVTYDVQGQGGQKLVEKYVYDGKTIKLASQSHYFGRHEPTWKNIGEQSSPAKAGQ